MTSATPGFKFPMTLAFGVEWDWKSGAACVLAGLVLAALWLALVRSVYRSCVDQPDQRKGGKRAYEPVANDNALQRKVGAVQDRDPGGEWINRLRSLLLLCMLRWVYRMGAGRVRLPIHQAIRRRYTQRQTNPLPAVQMGRVPVRRHLVDAFQPPTESISVTMGIRSMLWDEWIEVR